MAASSKGAAVLQAVSTRVVEAINAPYQVAGGVFVGAICLYAVHSGDRTERFSGVVLALAYLASVFAQDIRHWIGPQFGVLGVDIVVLGVLLVLALKTDRVWTVFAAAFHLLGVLTHLAIAIDTRLEAMAYATVLNLLAYLVFLALAAGTLQAARRRRSLSHEETG